MFLSFLLYYFQVSAKKAKLVSIATQTVFYLVKLFKLDHFLKPTIILSVLCAYSKMNHLSGILTGLSTTFFLSPGGFCVTMC